jgi:prepilin-type N-terminal cleavage/methylation domain-containing protein
MIKLARKAKGFSLIELMIYVMIVGMLMVVMLPKLKNLFRRVADVKENRILQNWNSKILEYYIDMNIYPDKLEDLNTRPTQLRDTSNWRRYTEDDNDVPVDSKQRELIYNKPPKIFGNLYKNYELFAVGEIDPDEATRDNITAKIGT